MDYSIDLLNSLVVDNILRYLGVATASYVALQATSSIYWSFRPSAISRCLQHDKACWAVITGASDGIGLAFAQELASQGFNLVLHGRNKQKLEGIVSRLATEFPKIQTRLFIADASSGEASASFQGLLDIVRDLHVTLLINNVGGEIDRKNKYAYLQDMTAEEINKLTELNAGFTTKITSALIPTLVKSQPSVILNIGSYAYWGMPKASIYSATKNYLLGFSEALQSEFLMAGDDVTVHGVLVGAVETKLGWLKNGLFTPLPSTFVKATLSRAGRQPVVMAGYWRHALQAAFVGLLPKRVQQRAFIDMVNKRVAAVAKTQ